jgi:hypothetical protein
MGTETGDAAVLKAKLDALVKDAEEAEEKAVAARRLGEGRCRCSPACAGLVFRHCPHVAVFILL